MSACSMSRMTRARPSMVPAETGRPTSAPGGLVSSVLPGDDFAVEGEHAGRRERLVGAKRVLALADQLLVHSAGAHDVVELVEGEVEDLFLVTKHVCLHEALDFFQRACL